VIIITPTVYPTAHKPNMSKTYDLARAKMPHIRGSLLLELHHNEPKVFPVEFETRWKE